MLGARFLLYENSLSITNESAVTLAKIKLGIYRNMPSNIILTNGLYFTTSKIIIIIEAAK